MPLFRRKKTEPPAPVEHAVIAHFTLSGDDFGELSERDALFELEDALMAAIEAAGVGEFDGNELGAGEAVLYAYGPSADDLFTVMEPLLRGFQARPAWCILRYGRAGDADATERRIDL